MFPAAGECGCDMNNDLLLMMEYKNKVRTGDRMILA